MEQNGFSIGNHFTVLDDPRKYNIRHNLIDIITITICAITCGAESWVDIEQYAKSKYDWLKQFLQLPNGIPSHDTFGRLSKNRQITSFHSKATTPAYTIRSACSFKTTLPT